MANSADPNQLASSEANWSGYTLQNRVYPGSAGQGLIRTEGLDYLDKFLLSFCFSGKGR